MYLWGAGIKCSAACVGTCNKTEGKNMCPRSFDAAPINVKSVDKCSKKAKIVFGTNLKNAEYAKGPNITLILNLRNSIFHKIKTSKCNT